MIPEAVSARAIYLATPRRRIFHCQPVYNKINSYSQGVNRTRNFAGRSEREKERDSAEWASSHEKEIRTPLPLRALFEKFKAQSTQPASLLENVKQTRRSDLIKHHTVSKKFSNCCRVASEDWQA